MKIGMAHFMISIFAKTIPSISMTGRLQIYIFYAQLSLCQDEYLIIYPHFN